MEYDFHGIIVQDSLKDQSLLSEVTILGQKNGRDWKLIRVGIQLSGMEKFVESISRNLRTEKGVPYYAHFYSKDKLIIVFPQKVFSVTPNNETWKPAIEYGLSKGVLLEQLDFFPSKVEDETF